MIFSLFGDIDDAHPAFADLFCQSVERRIKGK